jgi:hypothetical protein
MGSNYFRNWRANEVRKFAKEHGFVHKNTVGDDEFWSCPKLQALFRIPCNNEVLLLPTMMSMVRKSKIDRKIWLEWKNK